MDIGDGHLGRRDQPESVARRHVRLVGELGQLSGPRHGAFANQIGNAEFGVAPVGRVQADHPVDQPPLERRAPASQHEEAGARHPDPRREVEDPERLAQLPVRPRDEGELRGRAPVAHDPVRLLAARGHAFVGQVRNPRQLLGDPRVRGRNLRVQARDLRADLPHPGDLGGRVATLPLRLADPPGDPVPEPLEVVDASECLAPGPVPFNDSHDQRRDPLQPPTFQRPGDPRRIVAQYLDVKH